MKSSFDSLRRKLAQPSYEIMCARLALHIPGRAERTSLIEGPGRLKFKGIHAINFEVQAELTTEQISAVFRHLQPYWTLNNLHVTATDYDGNDWLGDAAVVQLRNFDGRPFVVASGNINCLQTDVVVPEAPACAVAIYADPPDVPLTESRQIKATLQGRTEFVKSEAAAHNFSVLGSVLSVVLDRDLNELSIQAMTSAKLVHPHLEHMLNEPLRVLHGARYFPRYILREFGNGTAFLSIIAHPPVKASHGGARRIFELIEPNGYWGYFSKYLEFICAHYDENHYADPNAITLYHDEANSSANSGSYWVVALALASAIEGLCKMHPGWTTSPSPVTNLEKSRAEQLLEDVKNSFLKDKLQKALENACREQQPVGSQVLKALVIDGVINEKHKIAWERLRHFVTHGNLLDHRAPDERLAYYPDLMELLHLLTANLIGFRRDDYPLSAAAKSALESLRVGVKTN